MELVFPKSLQKDTLPDYMHHTHWAAMSLFAKLTSRSFRDMLTSYKVASMCPVHLGAGDILLFMLGPAVVTLSCQMYDIKKLMKENLLEVGTDIGVSSVGGLFGMAFMLDPL
jgi:putative effector of murein hydrolase